MKYLIIILVLILVQTVHATCSEDQIDINSASLKELDKLTGIGEVKAQSIIDTRPFDSVNNLIKVYGIGEVTLEKIINQGLACVEDSDENRDNEDEEESNSEEGNKETDLDEDENLKEERYENSIGSREIKEDAEEKQIEIIELNSKDIKTADSNENKEPEKNYAVYGLLSFCVLLMFLFAIKKLKLKDYKNEFD